MYLKSSLFKKMLKEAYKGYGLTVGCSKEGYYLAGTWWVAWFPESKIPKEVKGAVIELCGDLPEIGQTFRANKEGNQYEIGQEEIYDLPRIYKECGHRYITTKVILERKNEMVRIIKDEKTNHVAAVKEIAINLIDNREIEEGETQPIGPVGKEIPRLILWGNERCYFMAAAGGAEETEKELWQAMEHIELP